MSKHSIIDYFQSINYSLKKESTTALRVVTNSSFSHKSGFALNSSLAPGPNLLNTPHTIINKMRFAKHILIGDVKTAYRNIRIDKNDRNYLLFVWFLDINNPKSVSILRHTRVPFGCSNSGSILEIVLRHVVAKSTPNPKVQECLLYNRFVDDFYLEAETRTALLSNAKQLDKVLNQFDFYIKQHHYLNEKIENCPFDHENAIKFLSLKICPKSDQILPNFSINVTRKIRGIYKGPPISISGIKDLILTKKVISRILGQTFCFVSIFLEPLLSALKIYFSIASKLTD